MEALTSHQLWRMLRAITTASVIGTGVGCTPTIASLPAQAKVSAPADIPSPAQSLSLQNELSEIARDLKAIDSAVTEFADQFRHTNDRDRSLSEITDRINAIETSFRGLSDRITHFSESQEQTPEIADRLRAIDVAVENLARRLAQSVDGPRGLDELARLAAIQNAVESLSKKAGKPDYMPALLTLAGTLFGVLLGAVVTFLTQRRLLAHQKALADDAARLQISNSLAQWQLKQLSELYGPLYALFRQSQTLYRHMNKVLADNYADQFQFVEDPSVKGFDKQVFQIKVDKEWVRFRTVLHLEKVYGLDYGIDDYFNGVVSIGARIVKVIEEKAGLVRPQQPQLVTLFGEYLAHYAVLERLHAHFKAKTEPLQQGAADRKPLHAQMKVDKSAVFPLEIQNMVDEGFEALGKELEVWRTKAVN